MGLSACEKGQQWREALRFLGEITQVWVTANVITFSAAISACEKGQQWGEALRLLGDMTQAWVTADVISFSAAISASLQACKRCFLLPDDSLPVVVAFISLGCVV